MSFRKSILLVLVLVITACDDLNPSGDDKRTPFDANTIGPGVGQIAPEFSLFDTEGNAVTMSVELESVDAIVLYFTMWCPICDAHMSHMRTQVIPNYPNVRFLIIDFISGSIEDSRTAQVNNGYTDLTVLVDTSSEVEALYAGTMGTTVVIQNAGGQGTILMNEDYKDSVKLTQTLDSLP
jgi:peroxiredoxin